MADENVNWWLNNNMYPLFFAWQSGASETLMNQLTDSVKDRLPFGFGFDIFEGVDRLVELVARKKIRWMWDEMKENARAASEPIPDPGAVSWSPTSPESETAMMDMPGASLTVLRLRDYIQQHGRDTVAVHLVGHSAGSIFHAGLLQRLADAGISVASLALLAPAIRVDEFARDILPHLGPQGLIRSFATFNLSDERELDDVCGAGGFDVYHKSLLYLVSRALEGSAPDIDVPLLGMQKFFDSPLRGQSGITLGRAISDRGGTSIFSRSITPDNSRCDALSHGGFARDRLTMTSVVMRALGVTRPRPENDYCPNAALTDADPAPPMGGRLMAGAAEAPSEQPTAPDQPVAPDQPGIPMEVAAAPQSGSPVLDILQARGWQPADDR